MTTTTDTQCIYKHEMHDGGCLRFSSLQAEKAEGFINLSGFTIEQAKQGRKKQYAMFVSLCFMAWVETTHSVTQPVVEQSDMNMLHKAALKHSVMMSHLLR